MLSIPGDNPAALETWLLDSGLKPAIDTRARMVALPDGPAQVTPDTLQYSTAISIICADKSLA